ncbi:MAG: septum formation protein Maf [Planctomycetes bacterium]|nr:septum formation protein Maf [Planctomycetota bacterium]
MVLASASPRRRELLAAAGLDFDVVPADVDEDVPEGTEPLAAARLLAERKARAVAPRVAPDRVVLAADTIVAVERAGRQHLLAKPEDERDAERMLAWLSGTRHQVVTGVCVLCARPGAPAVVGAERTWVTLRRIEPDEVQAYVASGEWRGKAGGYAIQETADRFVTRLEEGGFDNVVGLPVGLTLELLRRAGALVDRGDGGYPAPPSERA